ncbi:MAG: FAD-dependent oxidoreductase, partial [Melioribacteraceae bacterium]|nr:FAD-dependent oxidoreductase [Melioribacteraceae bacterium]
PFRSMLLSIQEKNIAHKNIHLFFGTRFKSGILYRDEFESWAQKSNNFKYSIALSREELNGYKGYVHALYMNEYPKKRDDIHFYICGWSSMIDDAVANLLLKSGYERSQIHYELYG